MEPRYNTATEMQNFLKHAPMQMFNLKPENGMIDLELDLTPYSYLYLVAVDDQQVVQVQVDLPEHPL